MRRHRCLLDVGGGDGSFLAAAGRRAPALRLWLFDLPAVAERARARLAAAGLAGRAVASGGDMFRDSLPAGADLVSLVRVVHDHDDDAALALLRAVRAALPADGTLLLAEPMAETRGAEPVATPTSPSTCWRWAAAGRAAEAELSALLRAAGFGRLRTVRTRRPLLVQLIVARP